MTTGLEFYDQDHVNLLSDFLVRYASNVNKNPDRHRFLKIVAAPRFVQNYSKDPPFDYKEPIEKIRIVQVMSLYGEKGFEETGRRTVFEKCL